MQLNIAACEDNESNSILLKKQSKLQYISYRYCGSLCYFRRKIC